MDSVFCVVGGRKTKANKYPWLVYLEIVDHKGIKLQNCDENKGCQKGLCMKNFLNFLTPSSFHI